jgi:hypothetical protein
MYVSTNNFKVALDETINELFSKLPLNFVNGINKLGINMFLSSKLDMILPNFVSNNGKINIDELEKYSKNLIPQVTANIIPAIGTSYKISEGDVLNFFSKLKQYGEEK